MKWPWTRETLPAVVELKQGTDLSLDQLIRRLDEQYASVAGVAVTPENCMQSPTVNAIVTAISRRISVSPLTVYQRSVDGKGREKKARLPNHPVAKLLAKPNAWQSRQTFFLDAASSLVRWGRFFAYKGQGSTGPIRFLAPLPAGCVTVKQTDSYELEFTTYEVDHTYRTLPWWQVLYARGGARDYITGDSPVTDCREAIALEMAMEKYGASFFGNGAMPLMFFKLMQGFQGFAKDSDREAFLYSVKDALSGRNAHSSFMLPKGIEVDKVQADNEQSQFIEARKYQRTVIAGAFGVPPHFVGDLERATFNNVEQQDTDFVINVVLPVAQQFESAMERDLLTDEDRRAGVTIRFNLDAIQRADFKTRQEGLNIQRSAGVINVNEWREAEGRNPIADTDGGEDYIHPANMVVSGEEPPPADPNAPPAPNDQPTDEGNTGE